MSIKSKTNGLIGTLVLAAVVVLGFQFVGPKTGRPDNPRMVIFSGVWLPSPRNLDGVHIQLTIHNSLKVDKVEVVAPFQRSYPVEKGSRVEIRLRLTGRAPSDVLGCSIAVDGTEVVNDHIPKVNGAKQTLKAGDSVTCWTHV